MSASRGKALRIVLAIGVVALSSGALFANAAVAQSARIGVDVYQTTTTTTQPPPPPTSAPAPPVVSTVPTPTTRVTTPATVPTVSSVPPTSEPPVVEAAPPPPTLPTLTPTQVAPPKSDDGFVSNFKTGVKTMRELAKGIASGAPLADVAEAVLPPAVADIVVPAIRTTSTFAFPVTLAAGVVAFLLVQRRIDASDPKLAASPIAHDDDEVRFR